MKIKTKKLAFPKLKSLYKYQQNDSSRNLDDTDPITTTLTLVTHVVGAR
jgi:hypothetical protein